MRILSGLFFAASFQTLAACSAADLDVAKNLRVAKRFDCTLACLSSPEQTTVPRLVTIRQDPGGLMIGYSLQMMKMRDSGTKVKFAGSCDSACTIYLSLPREQTCITRGASFGFHVPDSGTPEASHIAELYLLERYPEWVKAWIASRGGLSRRFKTMDYAYASRFLDRCDQVFATRTIRGHRS